jgi:hypothetical protein
MLGVDQELLWIMDERGLTVHPPLVKPCEYAVVIKITRGDVFK